MGTGKGLLDSLIAEGGVKSRDLSWEAWLLKLGGLGMIGMELNFMAILLHFLFRRNFLRSLVSILFLCN